MTRKPAAVRHVGPHAVPALLDRFAAWFDRLPFRALGVEGLDFEEIDEQWDPELTPVLRRAGFVWFTLGEGSMIVVLQVDAATPVVLLDSEGGAEMLAPSLEEFLIRWSKGKTGIQELDGSEDLDGITPEGKQAFRAWVEAQGVKAKKATAFDFDHYLEGSARPEPQAAATVRGARSPEAGLPPKFAELVALVGRRVDDGAVEAFVAKISKKKLAQATTDQNDSDYVTSKEQGISELSVTHAIENDLYPPISKTKRAYIPYVSGVVLTPAWKESLPFGLSWNASHEQVTKALGEPRMTRVMLGDDEFKPVWTRMVDRAAQVTLRVDPSKSGVRLWIRIHEAVDLVSRSLIEGDRTSVGVFVAWAIARDLLDVARFPAHRDLIATIRARKAQGSALVEAAMHDGLSTDHFVNRKGEGHADLHDRLWHYFADSPTLDEDLQELFGSVEGEHGHDKPDLETDDWKAVNRATKVLDKRFAVFLRS
jgi:hypothetical protein